MNAGWWAPASRHDEPLARCCGARQREGAALTTFFDTNVIVYALDPAEGIRQTTADGLIEQHLHARTLWISTQVLQETYAVLTRKKAVPPADALAALQAFPEARVVGASADSVLRAIGLAQQHRLSVWDALIVQAALQARCTTLLSEDLQAGQRFGALEVVNPFALSAHEPGPARAARSAATRTGRAPGR